MKRWVILVSFAIVAVAVLTLRPKATGKQHFVDVAVEQGAVSDRLICRGEFAPRDGRLIKVPFSGRLQFVVEDGTWVDEGDEIFAVAEDDAVREAAEARGQLLAERQDVRLARLRRQSVADEQERLVAKVERALELERLRWRIETATPVGGDALLRIDAALMPLEAVTQAARDLADRAEAEWQVAQDAYLDALDARSTHRDRILRSQARIDELSAAAGKDPAGLQAGELAKRAQAAEDLATVQQEIAGAVEQTAALAATVRDARAKRDQLLPARDVALAELRKAEAAEEDLRIRLEIEKRFITATQLRLDLAGAELTADQAVEELRRGEVAAEAGAISAARLEEIHESADRATGQVAILRSRLAIAERPTSPERLAELKARIERAETRAIAARSDRDRAIAIADQEVALHDAKVARLAYDVERRSAAFPEVLSSTIAFLDQEIAALDVDDPDDAERLVEAREEKTVLEKRLEEAREHPSNIILSPCAGVVRVQRNDDRAKQAGDQVWEEDVLIEVFPPENMAVHLQVNEVDIAKLSLGMSAQVTAPALPEFTATGSVTRLSALGRDKFEGAGNVAGVILFDGEVSVDRVIDGLRQGMTALVSVEVARREDVLHLPLAAVRETEDGWQVQRRRGSDLAWQHVGGEPFGDAIFIVTDGLAVGDIVVVEQN